MTDLYMIRHAEIQPIRDFVRDEGLSPLGKVQAQRLRDRLAGTGEIKADVLISSPLPRARQTAEIIAPVLGLEPIFASEIEEMRSGEAYGLPREEFERRYPEVDHEMDPFQRLAPGAENLGEFLLRVAGALERITHQYEGKTLVLVCHGGVIDSSLVYFFKMGWPTVPSTQLYIQNTGITHWQKNSNKQGKAVWKLRRYNDIMHLYDIGTRGRIHWNELAAGPVTDGQRFDDAVELEDASE